jgi:hypothetical protein
MISGCVGFIRFLGYISVQRSDSKSGIISNHGEQFCSTLHNSDCHYALKRIADKFKRTGLIEYTGHANDNAFELIVQTARLTDVVLLD